LCFCDELLSGSTCLNCALASPLVHALPDSRHAADPSECLTDVDRGGDGQSEFLAIGCGPAAYACGDAANPTQPRILAGRVGMRDRGNPRTWTSLLDFSPGRNPHPLVSLAPRTMPLASGNEGLWLLLSESM
jgi:hypothetical protein